MGRTLKSNVNVQNRWYGPAHNNAGSVPDDVAEQITNPAAWEEQVAAHEDATARAIGAEKATPDERPRKQSSRRSS